MTKLAEEFTPPGTAKAHKNVQIKNDHGQVDLDCIRISHRAGEQVKWSHHGAHEARIVFDEGSPFQQSTFIVQAGKSISSGLPTVKPDPHKLYKYSVHGCEGVNDPAVIIDP